MFVCRINYCDFNSIYSLRLFCDLANLSTYLNTARGRPRPCLLSLGVVLLYVVGVYLAEMEGLYDVSIVS